MKLLFVAIALSTVVARAETYRFSVGDSPAPGDVLRAASVSRSQGIFVDVWTEVTPGPLPAREGIALSPDGERVYWASSTGLNAISTQTWATSTIAVPARTYHKAVGAHPDNRRIYLGGVWSGTKLVEVDRTTLVSTEISLDACTPPACGSLRRIIVSPFGDKLWVLTSIGKLFEVAIATRAVTVLANWGTDIAQDLEIDVHAKTLAALITRFRFAPNAWSVVLVDLASRTTRDIVLPNTVDTLAGVSFNYASTEVTVVHDDHVARYSTSTLAKLEEIRPAYNVDLARSPDGQSWFANSSMLDYHSTLGWCDRGACGSFLSDHQVFGFEAGLEVKTLYPPAQARQYTTAFANGTPVIPLDRALTVKLADVNGDGKKDLCGRDGAGISCALSQGRTFGPTTRWTSSFGAAWSPHESRWRTIQFVDITGDGKADVCGRDATGLFCAVSNGTTAFVNYRSWSANFTDAQGWNFPQYWSTIQFADLDNDGDQDVCARGAAGMLCGLSNGVNGFAALTNWSTQYSDANSWNTSPAYYATIRIADIDGNSRPDVCGRGAAGIVCATNQGGGWGPATVWTTAFSDALGYGAEKYWSTIQLGTIDGDSMSDICGRGAAGMYCARSTGTAFEPPIVAATSFSDANGWGAGPQYYKSIELVDATGDGRADLCGRGNQGIYCAASNTWDNIGVAPVLFQPAVLWVLNFGDNHGWNGNEIYWGTVQAGNVDRWLGAEWCGRGTTGFICSDPL